MSTIEAWTAGNQKPGNTSAYGTFSLVGAIQSGEGKSRDFVVCGKAKDIDLLFSPPRSTELSPGEVISGAAARLRISDAPWPEIQGARDRGACALGSAATCSAPAGGSRTARLVLGQSRVDSSVLR